LASGLVLIKEKHENQKKDVKNLQNEAERSRNLL